jgi:hypothetical protein
MTIEKLASLVLRITFAGSLLLIGIACLERLLNYFGYTILPEAVYSPGRLLEFAAVFVIVVIALLLRQVRDELRKTRDGSRVTG